MLPYGDRIIVIMPGGSRELLRTILSNISIAAKMLEITAIVGNPPPWIFYKRFDS